jgi:hypothetical protein
MPLPVDHANVMYKTVDHVTFKMAKMSDETDPISRLWIIIKQFPQDDPAYLVALNESLVVYYSKRGCVYRGREDHHASK